MTIMEEILERAGVIKEDLLTETSLQQVAMIFKKINDGEFTETEGFSKLAQNAEFTEINANDPKSKPEFKLTGTDPRRARTDWARQVNVLLGCKSNKECLDNEAMFRRFLQYVSNHINDVNSERKSIQKQIKDQNSSRHQIDIRNAKTNITDNSYAH